MKQVNIVLRLAVGLAAGISLTSTWAHAGYNVVECGRNYRVLQSTASAGGAERVHRCVEVANGMNYTNASGQWLAAQEQIAILPQGGAAATQGQHQVYFPADIASGVLEVVTPDGRHLRSRPLGVSYDDGNNVVWIAQLQHSIGWLTQSNQVTYPDAFAGINADLVCTYHRGGFESDLVFRAQPPTPDTFGLDPVASTVQMVTEFFNPQDPQQVPSVVDEGYGLQDTTLKFGDLTMTQGKAFVIKSANGQSKITSPTSVYKSWLHLQNRTFLIEQVPLPNLAIGLQTLPVTADVQASAAGSTSPGLASLSANAALAGAKIPAPLIGVVSAQWLLPPACSTATDTNQIQIASAAMNQRPGVVLDYLEIAGNLGDFTFQANTTYFISSPVVFDHATIQGGVVIKYPLTAQSEEWPMDTFIQVNNSMTLSTDADHPAIFTSADDDSVGETVKGIWSSYTGVVTVPDLGN